MKLQLIESDLICMPMTKVLNESSPLVKNSFFLNLYMYMIHIARIFKALFVGGSESICILNAVQMQMTSPPIKINT